MSSGRLIGRDHAFDLRAEFLFVSGTPKKNKTAENLILLFLFCVSLTLM